MDSLEIKLTSAIIDNFATPNNKTVVDLKIRNDKGRIHVKNLEGISRSVHLFTIHDSRDLYCPPYDEKKSSKLFVIALSLYNPRFYFSPLQPHLYSPNLKLGKIPSKVEEHNTPTGKKISITETIRSTYSVSTILKTYFEIKENELFKLIEILQRIEPFNTNSRTNFELNIIDSLERYFEAINSGNPLDSYKSLYFSFEKAINSSEEYKGSAFDKEAARITGLDFKQIEELRRFINRVKHRIRNEKDLEKLRSLEKNLFQLLRILKEATDKSLLMKLNLVK